MSANLHWSQPSARQLYTSVQLNLGNPSEIQRQAGGYAKWQGALAAERWRFLEAVLVVDELIPLCEPTPQYGSLVLFVPMAIAPQLVPSVIALSPNTLTYNAQTQQLRVLAANLAQALNQVYWIALVALNGQQSKMPGNVPHTAITADQVAQHGLITASILQAGAGSLPTLHDLLNRVPPLVSLLDPRKQPCLAY